MRRTLIFLVCALPLLLAAACGDDDDAPPTATGPAGSDEDYLRAVCIGTSNFSNALLSKTSAEDIAAVVREFADEMRALNPPADLAEYNARFVAYLEAALEEPTSLVTTAPPEPPADARRRLAALEPTIPECKDPTFFSRDDAP
jgi:hypothetical protein